MSTEEKTPAEILSELEQQLAAKTIEVKGADPETARKIEERKADLEYLGLVGKFNALGKQHQKYAIVDVTAHGKGFIVVVVGPKAELHRKTIAALAKDEKLTDASLLAIVRECVQHPALDKFDEIVSELPSVTGVCFHAVEDLWGARAKIRLEK